MHEQDVSARKLRPEFRNINVFTNLPNYRLPLAALVSILHRISGALMFLLLPFIIWMFDLSVSSEISYERLMLAFGVDGTDGVDPATVLLKLVVLALIWAYLHHLIAGLRHLWMDMNHAAVANAYGRRTAAFTLIASIALTLALGAKLFGAW